jgi:hypothetical protein
MFCRSNPETKAYPRLAAAVIAVAAWLGLVLQFSATFSHVGSVRSALWILADYFTILTNLVIALVFTGLCIRWEDSQRPRLLAGLTLAILLVGVVYAILLRPIDHPQGLARPANTFLHVVTPILVTLFWLGIVQKGALRFFDPFVFAAFPLLYFAYVMGRGAGDGHYPYFFVNVAKIGLHQTLINAVLIAAGFLIAGYALLGLDQVLSRLQRRP